MSSGDERKNEINSRYKEEYEAAHNVELQLDAWNEFAMTGKSSALAKYLSLDGEFDDDVRKMVIKILLDGPFHRPGGANLWRDYEAYAAINRIRMETVILKGKCTLQQAQEEFRKKPKKGLRTVQLQYRRAEALLKRAQD